MPYGFGIIGCGMIANFHAKAIADLSEGTLVGCQSRNPESAETFAKANNCEAFPTVAEMLADPKIDIVSICTPSGAHRDPAIAAAESGKHVIIEKPLEVTLDRCDAIIEACAKNNVVLSTVFQSRFHRASELLKQAIDENRFGRLSLGDAYVKWFRTQEYYDSGAWRGTWELDGGGALMNQAIHCVDLLTWLMGPVAEISAATATLAHERIEVEDVAVATLRFENGALGVIEATTASYPGMSKKIEIHGSEGCAVVEEEDITVWSFKDTKPDDAKVLGQSSKASGGASDPAAIGHQAHTKQFQDVIDAIKNGTKPLIDGHEGRRSVEIIRAIYQAAESGQKVKLPL